MPGLLLFFASLNYFGGDPGPGLKKQPALCGSFNVFIREVTYLNQGKWQYHLLVK